MGYLDDGAPKGVVFPDDLPSVIVWLLNTYPDMTGQNGGRPCDVVLASYPRRQVESISSSGDTNADTVRPQMPYGWKGWRLLGETVWHGLMEIPPAWLPFLDREKETPMDPRTDPVKEERRKVVLKKAKEARERMLAKQERETHEQ
jgi:hypothetical protein